MTDDDRDMSDLDPDFVLISAYLDDELTEAERDSFDQRCIRDKAFAEKALPLLAVQAADIDWSKHLAQARRELEEKQRGK